MPNRPLSNTIVPEVGLSSSGDQAMKIRVRMYRQGLGDCFLISFFLGETEKHVLIDCGVYQGTKDSETIMRKVTRHIRRTTNRRLDLVVATHEHWDHLSGFVQAQDIFNQIEMKQVWLAWTEDPSNPLAEELRQERALALNALQSALGLLPANLASQAETVHGLLDFFGPSLNASSSAHPAAPSSSAARQALDYLATRPDAKVSYCQPGEPPRLLEGLPGVRFFVLGPPANLALLKKSEPTKKGKEGYGLSSQLTLASSFFAAIQQLEAGLPTDSSPLLDFPFEAQFRLPVEQARQDPFFIQYYGFDEKPDHGAGWRRIDRDWMGLTSQLALRLDQATNNTSLVLAIELVDSCQVLLFAADAQVGNWLSWMDLAWDLPTGNGTAQTIRASDLLARTALYKVGHHGSRNATLREQGLERMQNPDLIALLPVQREMAERQHWNMPFPDLYQRLLEKTRGRLIRMDDGLLAAPHRREAGLQLLTQTEWKTFQRQINVQPLYIDCLIAG